MLKNNPGDDEARMSYCDMIEQLSLLNAQVQCNAIAEILGQVDIDKLADGVEGLTQEQIDKRKEVVAAEVDVLKTAAEIIGRYLAASRDEDVDGSLDDRLTGDNPSTWN